jgi:molybdopterin converting factor small subunit
LSVRVVLPAQLREMAGGRATVPLEGSVGTVAEALEALRATIPGVYDRIVTERRELRRHINVYVGSEDIRWTGGLATPLDEDSEVVILPAVSGG